MSDLLQQYKDAFNLLESGTKTVLYRLQEASEDGGKVLFPYMDYLNSLLYNVSNPVQCPSLEEVLQKRKSHSPLLKPDCFLYSSLTH